MDARVKPAHDEKGESMPYETILYDADGAVATITLNRPEQLNTIVPPMPDEIEAAVHEAVRGPNVKLIVLRGAGARSAADSISAPASISGTNTSTTERRMGPGQGFRARDRADAVADAEIHEPVARAEARVAQVHGWCVGGGWDYALCADLVIAGEDARIGTPYSRLWGAYLSGMWIYRLGLTRVKEHALTGKPLSGKEAAEVGLISRAVPLVSAMRRSQQPRNSSPAFRCRSSPP